jgi:hypothetical protein
VWGSPLPVDERDSVEGERAKVVMVAAQPQPDFRAEWAILDSNQGPPPYQSGALTN